MIVKNILSIINKYLLFIIATYRRQTKIDPFEKGILIIIIMTIAFTTFTQFIGIMLCPVIYCCKLK